MAKRAVRDGATVPVYYESRLIPLDLPAGERLRRMIHAHITVVSAELPSLSVVFSEESELPADLQRGIRHRKRAHEAACQRAIGIRHPLKAAVEVAEARVHCSAGDVGQPKRSGGNPTKRQRRDMGRQPWVEPPSLGSSPLKSRPRESPPAAPGQGRVAHAPRAAFADGDVDEFAETGAGLS